MRLISQWLFRIRATLFPGRLEEAMKEEMAAEKMEVREAAGRKLTSILRGKLSSLIR